MRRGRPSRQLRLSSADFGAADFHERAAPFSLERNQIHMQSDGSATGYLRRYGTCSDGAALQ